MHEFDLIKRYFNRQTPKITDQVLLAIGDDCALTCLQPNQHLAITTDTLVSGTHFLPTISPEDLGYKSVAVNLSDLAAMGATPKWVSLALTLPKADEKWLESFSFGFFSLLEEHQICLIGGDTTKGELSLTLTAQGTLPKGKGLFRHQAKIGDWIFVSGSLGDSAAGLDILLHSNTQPLTPDQYYLIQRHLRPTPRIALGQLLTQFCHCAIDISDGLLADLNHILTRSECGAELYLEQLPLSQSLLAHYSQIEAEQFALNGGEDYELCFTVADNQREVLEQSLTQAGLPYYCIGKIVPQTEGFTLYKRGKKVPLLQHTGFNHFKE